MNRKKKVEEARVSKAPSGFGVLAEPERDTVVRKPAKKQEAPLPETRAKRDTATTKHKETEVISKAAEIKQAPHSIMKKPEETTDLQLIQRYERFVGMVQHRNLETYARLLQLLFGSFSIPNEPGPISIRTGELVRILEKTQTKYNLSIQNESMEQILRIFTAICKKLGGTPEYRLTRIPEIESSMSKLYSDSELLAFLYELDTTGVQPDAIQRINSRDEIVLKSNATLPLPVSQKWKDFIDILMRGQSEA